MLKKSKILFHLFLIIFCLFYIKLIYQTLSPKIPTKTNPIIFYSNQCRQDLRSTIIKAIKSAKSSIHLVMFGLSDEKVIKELKSASEKHIKMNVFYDSHSSPEIDFQNNVAKNIKKSYLMHQKILVLDNTTVFLGSANMTKSSLSMHDNLIIGIHSPEIASFLSEKTPFSSGRINKNINLQEVEIWLLPDSKNAALEKLVNLIQTAKKKIKIAMFTLTHPLLIDELIKAKKRGIEVSIVVDCHSGIGASAKAVEKLKKEGVNVLLSCGTELLHHKYLYIDEKTLVCGSANWTKAAFHKNKDLILIINNLQPPQISFMNKLQKIIEVQAD